MTQPTNQVTDNSIDTPEFREKLFAASDYDHKHPDKALNDFITHINAFVAKAEQDAYNIARAEFDLYHKKRVAEVVKETKAEIFQSIRDSADKMRGQSLGE